MLFTFPKFAKQKRVKGYLHRILSMENEVIYLQPSVWLNSLHWLGISNIRVDSWVRKIVLFHLLEAFCKVGQFRLALDEILVSENEQNFFYLFRDPEH